MQNNCQRSWVEISTDKLLQNYRIYKASIPQDIAIMAVVKADAYGHGDAVVSKILSDNGLQLFAVSNIDEAIHVRKAGVTGRILILGYTPLNRVDDLRKYDIVQTLLSEEYASEISKLNQGIRCEFAIDTGMKRIGLDADNINHCERIIRQYANRLNIEGLFTHLCVADTIEQNNFTNEQIRKFEEVCKRVSDLRLPYTHCMNSAGGLWHTSATSVLARLGIILYGLKPDYSNNLPEGIEPVLAWKSVVSMVKEIRQGDTIGYGRTYRATSDMCIATIPTGYADGYSRLLSNKGWVLINGQKAPIVGRICMDQMMVDVSGINDVHMGTEVVLIGKSGDEILTADDLANLYGTIGYEVICGISKRVERMYLG